MLLRQLLRQGSGCAQEGRQLDTLTSFYTTHTTSEVLFDVICSISFGAHGAIRILLLCVKSCQLEPGPDLYGAAIRMVSLWLLVYQHIQDPAPITLMFDNDEYTGASGTALSRCPAGCNKGNKLDPQRINIIIKWVEPASCLLSYQSHVRPERCV